MCTFPLLVRFEAGGGADTDPGSVAGGGGWGGGGELRVQIVAALSQIQRRTSKVGVGGVGGREGNDIVEGTR